VKEEILEAPVISLEQLKLYSLDFVDTSAVLSYIAPEMTFLTGQSTVAFKADDVHGVYFHILIIHVYGRK